MTITDRKLRRADLKVENHISSRCLHYTGSGAHNPERATPILGLCHGVFTDQFIFGHILGHFFPRKWNLHRVSLRGRRLKGKGKGILALSVYFKRSFNEKLESYTKPTVTSPNFQRTTYYFLQKRKIPKGHAR